MNDERASMLRTMKFVLPVFIFAVLFNIPKFFEAEITYLPSSPDTPVLKVTDLRKGNYPIINMSSRLFGM